MPANNNLHKEPLLTVREIAQAFNLKESRLRWEIFQKRIPFYKIGASIRLRASEVEAWLYSKRQNHED